MPKFIGEIVWDREAYHTNRYIFPVGFMSKKQYLSAVDVTRRTTYTSEILDGGDTPIVSELTLCFHAYDNHVLYIEQFLSIYNSFKLLLKISPVVSSLPVLRVVYGKRSLMKLMYKEFLRRRTLVVQKCWG